MGWSCGVTLASCGQAGPGTSPVQGSHAARMVVVIRPMMLHHPEPFSARWRAHWIWHEPPAITTETATRAVLRDPRGHRGPAAPAGGADLGAGRGAVSDLGRRPLRAAGERHRGGPRPGAVRPAPGALRRGRPGPAPAPGHQRARGHGAPLRHRHLVVGAGAAELHPRRRVGGARGAARRPLGGHRPRVGLPPGLGVDAGAGAGRRGVPAARVVRRPGPPPRLGAARRSTTAAGRPWWRSRRCTPAPTATPRRRATRSACSPRRCARRSPTASVHPAEATASAWVGGAASVADPVAQVLADEAIHEVVAAHAYVSLQSFDLGRIAAGTLELSVRGAVAGTVIDVAAAEHLDDAGRLATLGQHAGLRYVCTGGDEERFESFDLIGARHLHASVRPPHGEAGARAGPGRARSAPAPPRGRRLRLLRPAARADPRRGPAHGRPLRARRLRRLPHPGAAGVDGRLRGAPDGGPGGQPRLVDGPLAPAAGRRAAGRRDAGHGGGLGLRRRRPDVHPRLVAALGPLAAQPLPLHR